MARSLTSSGYATCLGSSVYLVLHFRHMHRCVPERLNPAFTCPSIEPHLGHRFFSSTVAFLIALRLLFGSLLLYHNIRDLSTPQIVKVRFFDKLTRTSPRRDVQIANLGRTYVQERKFLYRARNPFRPSGEGLGGHLPPGNGPDASSKSDDRQEALSPDCPNISDTDPANDTSPPSRSAPSTSSNVPYPTQRVTVSITDHPSNSSATSPSPAPEGEDKDGLAA